MAGNNPLSEIDPDNPRLEKLIAEVVYQLGECFQCRKAYAILRDPRQTQYRLYYIFDRATQRLSHYCTNGTLCLRGHELELTCLAATYTHSGKWVRVTQVRS